MAVVTPIKGAVALTNQKELVAQLETSLGESNLVLKSLHGIEKISELFEFRVVFQSENPALDQDKALGTSFTIKIKADKEERIINGIVAEFSQGATQTENGIDLTEYIAVLRPKLWYLTLDRNYLIFQKKTAIDIIKQVLKDGGVTDVDDKTKSRGKIKREYCVQYGESSFNFVSRLMEDEGIFYFFEHSSGKHVMVLADSSVAHKPISGDKKIEFIQGVQSVFPLGIVFNTSMTTAFNTGGYITADYNYTISKTKLYSKLDSQYKDGPKYYEYPGNYEKSNEGDDLAKLRVEGFELSHCLLKASSTVPRITPGFAIEISGHHADKFNSEFVAYNVEHFYDFT
ncbi:MAG: type VI secretion system tip protein VgrG, partial [Alphaproteobacteria bacterium]|nr:type VI secretion system tip protein VgrG [Alphaproteobacteria bacterium]